MPGSGLLRVSTETFFPEKDRFSRFREEFVRRVMAMDAVDHSGGRPRVDLTFLPLGRTAAGSLRGTPMEMIRGKGHLKDGIDGFVLEIVSAGSVRFEHAGEARLFEPGTACLIDHARPHRGFGLRTGSAIRNVTVDAAALKTLVPDAEDLAGRPILSGPALRLLDGYLLSLQELGELPPGHVPVVDGHLLDLAAAVLGPSAEAAETVAAGGVKAARRQAICAVITRRFSDPGFNVDSLARAVGLSRRYVQALLEDTGTPFTDRVLELRLARAFALLTDPRHRHLSITEIAATSGFGDVSHFNRMFRRRYGDTPSGVRPSAGRK